jgi:hypothetical protein
LSALHTGRIYPQEILPVLISVRDRVDPRLTPMPNEKQSFEYIKSRCKHQQTHRLAPTCMPAAGATLSSRYWDPYPTSPDVSEYGCYCMLLSGTVINYAHSFLTPSRLVCRQSSRLILLRYLVLVSAETPAILIDVFYDFS